MKPLTPEMFRVLRKRIARAVEKARYEPAKYHDVDAVALEILKPYAPKKLPEGWGMLTAVIVTNKDHPLGPTPILKFSAIPSGASEEDLKKFPSLRRTTNTDEFEIDFDNRTVKLHSDIGLMDCGVVEDPKRFGADFGLYVAS